MPTLNPLAKAFHYLTNYQYARYKHPAYYRHVPSSEAIHAINQHQLYLGVSFNVAEDILKRGELPPHYRYRHFHQPKKDGSPRLITEPDPQLKAIQQTIAKFLGKFPPHPAAIAYRRNRSIADHAWKHAGASTIITADITDFFPNTNAVRVLDWWRKTLGIDDDAGAELLTLFTTYQGGLPQGAPTSPFLSNLVNHRLDEQLTHYANRGGGTYSRYCDDLAFSWRNGDHTPANFEATVRNVLREHGYQLHPRKGWLVFQREDEPEITGLILAKDGELRLPPHIHHTIRSLQRSKDPADQARLNGYLAYQAMVEGH